MYKKRIYTLKYPTVLRLKEFLQFLQDFFYKATAHKTEQIKLIRDNKCDTFEDKTNSKKKGWQAVAIDFTSK